MAWGRWLLRLLLLVAIVVGMIWAGEFGFGPVVITKEDESRVIVGLTGPRSVITEPGWDPTVWKIPVVDEVHTFDRRLQYLNAPPLRVLIANNEKLVVDFYVVWRITDPLDFLKNFPQGGDASRLAAENRIEEVVKSRLGSRLGGLTLQQLLGRSKLLGKLEEDASENLLGTGLEVIDVRLNRTELPPNAVPSAYAQMREQRKALARESRALGERRAREVVAKAERLAATTLAKARADSERTRGEGDAGATQVFASAYQKDPEFYSFVRSLEAYRNSLKTGTTMVLSPSHEFLRYLESSQPDAPPRRARRPAVSSPPAP